MEVLRRYVNGTAMVTLYEDGTKVRTIPFGETYLPRFPETIDINTSDRCAHGCSFCYISATSKKQHGDLDILFERLQVPRSTELALNLNSEIPNGMTPERLLELGTVNNLTINGIDVSRHFPFLRDCQNIGAMYGVGISVDPRMDLRFAALLDNVVYHVINGVHDADSIISWLPKQAKILVLGYKFMKGRGKTHRPGKFFSRADIMRLFETFSVVSFDNLALNQLNVEEIVGPDVWRDHYMGDDATSSMYINLVDETFSPSSISPVHYRLPSGRIKISDLFERVRNVH